MTPQAARAPAFPVVKESALVPLPRSSVPWSRKKGKSIRSSSNEGFEAKEDLQRGAQRHVFMKEALVHSIPNERSHTRSDGMGR